MCYVGTKTYRNGHDSSTQAPTLSILQIIASLVLICIKDAAKGANVMNRRSNDGMRCEDIHAHCQPFLQTRSNFDDDKTMDLPHMEMQRR